VASVDNAGTPGVPDVVLSSGYDPAGNRKSLAATIGGTKDFLNSYSYDTLSRLDGISQQSQTGGNALLSGVRRQLFDSGDDPRPNFSWDA
jgi:hypothetical protein